MAPKLSGTHTFFSHRAPLPGLSPWECGWVHGRVWGCLVKGPRNAGSGSYSSPPPRQPRAAVPMAGHCCDFSLGPSGGAAVMRGLTETQGFPGEKVRSWIEKGAYLSGCEFLKPATQIFSFFPSSERFLIGAGMGALRGGSRGQDAREPTALALA